MTITEAFRCRPATILPVVWVITAFFLIISQGAGAWNPFNPLSASRMEGLPHQHAKMRTARHMMHLYPTTMRRERSMLRVVGEDEDAVDPTDYVSSTLNNVANEEMLDPPFGEEEVSTPALTVNAPQVVNGEFESLLINGVDAEEGGRSVCKVVASSDGKLPTDKSSLPPTIQEPPYILKKLDAIYHAISHEETHRLKYMERSTAATNVTDSVADETEESRLVSVLRNSLEDAGFVLLSKRDIDLCEALNAGYLLRLAISPDVSEFDRGIAKEFYPERFGDNTTETNEWWPFEERVLIYRRGYSSEVTQGRLLVPKLDYLQANIVQRSAYSMTELLGRFERKVARSLSKTTTSIKGYVQSNLVRVVDNMPNESLRSAIRSRMSVAPDEAKEDDSRAVSDPFFKLSRYGGRKSRFMGSPSVIDALSPFMTAEEDGSSGDGVNGASQSTEKLTCEYDMDHQVSDSSKEIYDPGVLLQRSSISDVVDLTGREGRRSLVRRFLSISKLVEPTYEEVVTIWRPLPDRNRKTAKPFIVRPPKFAYDFAEIFEVDDRLPKLEEPKPDPQRPRLEIRAFDDVPMANVPAVLPKTKLMFRPADAFVFDLVTVLSFVVVFSSQRFNSPRLDLLAVVSVSLWLFRTLIRYSNKLARYDLLVKKFLTSKISHRNAGALKYITREAGTQRATRASLVYLWLVQRMTYSRGPVTKSQLINEGALNVNKLFDSSNDSVRVDVDAALNDLEDLNLVRFSEADDVLQRVTRYDDDVGEVLMSTWCQVFEGKMPLKKLIGRREQHPN